VELEQESADAPENLRLARPAAGRRPRRDAATDGATGQPLPLERCLALARRLDCGHPVVAEDTFPCTLRYLTLRLMEAT